VPNAQNGEIVQRMNYDEFGNVILDSKPGLPAFFLLYSPKCLEGECSEVGIQDRAYPQPPVTLDLHQVALIPSDRLQHLALQNKVTSQRIQTE
jgi:hypothetical protein